MLISAEEKKPIGLSPANEKQQAALTARLGHNPAPLTRRSTFAPFTFAGFITPLFPVPFPRLPAKPLLALTRSFLTNAGICRQPGSRKAWARRRAAPAEAGGRAAAGAILPPAACAALSAARWRPCAAAGPAAAGRDGTGRVVVRVKGKGEADIMLRTGSLARPHVPVWSHPGRKKKK